jgi:hypothetical protein
MEKQNRKALREELRDRLQSIASQAQSAQRMSATSDNLCDLIDDIDNDVQATIEIINRLRRNGETSS